MADVTYENALKAMRKAHEAGDTEAAKRMARLAQSLKDGQPQRDPNQGFMGQVNRGIADVVDFVNPFNDPAWENVAGGALKMPDASEAMRSVGIRAATGEPETFVQGFGRGVGEAAAAFAPTVKGLQALSNLPGAVGAAARDAYTSMLSVAGLGAEVAASGVSRGAGVAAENMGASPAVRTAVEVAAPVAALPAMTRAATKLPAVQATRAVGRMVAPFTKGGAEGVVQERLRGLVGTERMQELGETISPRNEFGLSPAQQTGDPNLLGLEAQAALENPQFRVRLAEQRATSEAAMADALKAEGGDPADLRSYAAARLKDYRASTLARVDRALTEADASAGSVLPGQSEASASRSVVGKLKMELDDALAEEAQKWAAVPNQAAVPTTTTRDTVKAIQDATPRAQKSDIPGVIGVLKDFGDVETVAEMHGLYSELRRVARSAMAGNDQNKNKARIANEIADAILQDLDAVDAQGEVGRAIADARAFSRALHETFDRGAVGRILKRTLDGEEAIAAESALNATVGRSGAQGGVDDATIRNAAPSAASDISDFIRGRFSEAMFDASGKFTPKSAMTWMRTNAELLARYPELRKSLTKALGSRQKAEAFAIRTEARAKLADASAAGQVLRGKPDQTVQTILAAENPAKTARSLAATARKDPSGKALDGLKGAFSDYLTQDLSRLPVLMDDAKFRAALTEVFDAPQVRRMQVIASSVRKMRGPDQSVGEVLDAPVNSAIDMIVRVAAVKGTANLHSGGGAGVGLQVAQMTSNRAKDLMRRLTNTRARQLLNDALEDPALMRDLMVSVRAGNLPKKTVNRLAPYLIGGAVGQVNQE